MTATTPPAAAPSLHLRQTLLWCLPALSLGLVLRTLLMWQLPHGLYAIDSNDLLETSHRLLAEGRWVLHAKKTFLVPALYAVPALLGWPTLIAVPVFQHLLGLLMIALVGLLCRHWLTRWQWWIIPVTLLVAGDPAFLFYEHTLLAESLFAFCTVLVAAAGTLYTLRPNWPRLVYLCLSLVLVAGARPEGKLLFGFGLLLVLFLHARSWRTEWPRMALMLAVAAATHPATRTTQSGVLLYASVLRFSEPYPRAAPDLEPYIAPVREEFQARWEERGEFPDAADRRRVRQAVYDYLKDQRGGVRAPRPEVDALCQQLAAEICRQNLHRLPWHALQKWRETALEPTAGLLDREALVDEQQRAFRNSLDAPARTLSRRLLGRDIGSTDALESWVAERPREVKWYNRLSRNWRNAVHSLHLKSTRLGTGPVEKRKLLPGLPLLALVAGAGVVAAMVQRARLQPLHIAWGVSLVALLFVILLVANTKPRFRFVFEPFWFLYVAVFFDVLVSAVRARLTRT